MNEDGPISRDRRADRTSGPGPAADGRPLGLDDPRAIQILATEHWSLLAARTLSWNESFSRTSMLLATLSAAMVALALAAQVAGFDAAFLAFALVVLTFVEVVGLATFARLGEANGEDLQSLQGMNRIRHAYVEIAPQLEPYFVTPRSDDLPALLSAYGMGPDSMSSLRGGLHHAFVMTQGMVGIVNAMVAGVFGFLLATDLGAPATGAVVAGAVLVASTVGLQAAIGASMYRRRRDTLTVHFPSAGSDHGIPPGAQTRPTRRDRRLGASERPDRQETLGGFLPRLRDSPWREGAGRPGGPGRSPS